ncbi:MAG: aldo/keto reductase [Candidatus Xenobiia bacterium LiM19]
MMKRIVLGRTGLETYRMGFGGIPIQTVTEREAIEAVIHAIQRGVEFIDTSRAYTTSEGRIGKALEEAGKKVILATKSHGRTSDAIRKDIEISLKELRTGYIDIYQCHFVRDNSDYEKIIAPGGALDGLNKAKEEGLIGHYGLTSHSLDLLKRVVEENLFETVMVCYSFLEPAAEDTVIPMALEKNIGVIAMKPFSGGAIVDMALALKYVLSRPDILIIPGVEHKELFDLNWQIFEGDHGLTGEEKQQIEKIRKAHDKVFCRRCDYCQPCSEGIPIQIVLGFKYLVKRSGPGVFRHPIFRDVLAKAGKCSGCGQCLSRCPYGLPIPDLIRETLAWLETQPAYLELRR